MSQTFDVRDLDSLQSVAPKSGGSPPSALRSSSTLISSTPKGRMSAHLRAGTMVSPVMVRMAVRRGTAANVLYDIGHNYKDHDYVGHDYIGHDYIAMTR